MSEQKNKLLEVKDLKVSFFTPAGEVKAVGGISYDLDYGEVMGVVGESGSGKSQEAYSIMGLLQSPGKVIGGSITFEGKDVLPDFLRSHFYSAFSRVWPVFLSCSFVLQSDQ